MTFFGTLSVWFLTWECSHTDVFLALSKVKPKKWYEMLWKRCLGRQIWGFPASSTLAESSRNFPALEGHSCQGLFPANMFETGDGGPHLPLWAACIKQQTQPNCAAVCLGSRSGLNTFCQVALLQSQIFAPQNSSSEFTQPRKILCFEFSSGVVCFYSKFFCSSFTAISLELNKWVIFS